MDAENYRRHRAGVAAVLSFVLCGLGQIYNGDIKKGLKLMFWSSFFIFILILGSAIVIYQIAIDVLNPGLMIRGIIIALAGVILSSIISVSNIFGAYRDALNK